MGAEEGKGEKLVFHLICATNKTVAEEDKEGSMLADFRDRIGLNLVGLPNVAARIFSFRVEGRRDERVAKATAFFTPLTEKALKDLERFDSKDGYNPITLATQLAKELAENAVSESSPYLWPGNFREVVARTRNHLWHGDELIPRALGNRDVCASAERSLAIDERSFDQQVKEFQQLIIRSVLDANPRSSNEECARKLDMTRQRFEKKLRDLKLVQYAKTRKDLGLAKYAEVLKKDKAATE